MATKNGSKKNGVRGIGTLKKALEDLNDAFATLDWAIHEAGLTNKVVFIGDVRGKGKHWRVEGNGNLLSPCAHAERYVDPGRHHVARASNRSSQ